MLANFFGKSNPITLVVILTTFLAYLFGFVFFDFGIENFLKFDLIFYGKLGLLYIAIFFFYNFILAKNKLTLSNSYGFLFFVILFGLFPQVFFDTQELIVQIVVFIYIRKILSLRNATSTIQKVFDSGFWVAILFMLEPFSILFALLFVLALSMFQKIKGQLLLVFLVGLITPMIIYYTYCLWYDMTNEFYNMFLLYSSFDISFYLSYTIGIPLGMILLFCLISILIKTPNVISISGKYRKYWTLIISYFLIALMYVFLKDKSGGELLAIFFPVAVILTNWLEGVKRKWLKNSILVVFIVAPVLLFII